MKTEQKILNLEEVPLVCRNNEGVTNTHGVSLEAQATLYTV